MGRQTMLEAADLYLAWAEAKGHRFVRWSGRTYAFSPLDGYYREVSDPLEVADPAEAEGLAESNRKPSLSKYVRSKVKDDPGFADKVSEETKGRILFLDGVLDREADRVTVNGQLSGLRLPTPGGPKFASRVPWMLLGDSRGPENRDEVMGKIADPLFGESREDVFLMVRRALSGSRDRKLHALIGGPEATALATEILGACLGDYCCTSTSSVFTKSEGHNTDVLRLRSGSPSAPLCRLMLCESGFNGKPMCGSTAARVVSPDSKWVAYNSSESYKSPTTFVYVGESPPSFRPKSSASLVEVTTHNLEDITADRYREIRAWAYDTPWALGCLARAICDRAF